MIMTMDIGGTKTLWTIWKDNEILDRGTFPTNTIADFTEFIKTQYERLLSGQGLSNIFSCVIEGLEEKDPDTIACRPRQKMHPAQKSRLWRNPGTEKHWKLFASSQKYWVLHAATTRFYTWQQAVFTLAAV